MCSTLPPNGKAMTINSVVMFVPNSFVGAIIGTKGAYIKILQQVTGASVSVEPDRSKHLDTEGVDRSGAGPSDVDEFTAKLSEDIVKSAIRSVAFVPRPDHGGAVTRFVTIAGHDDEILRAMFWVYQRVAEVQSLPISAVSLHSEFYIPDLIVGIVIGRNGYNVNQLKRVAMGCDIHVQSNHDGSDAKVTIDGTYGQALIAISRINFLHKALLRDDKRRKHVPKQTRAKHTTAES